MARHASFEAKQGQSKASSTNDEKLEKSVDIREKLCLFSIYSQNGQDFKKLLKPGQKDYVIQK